MSQEEEPESSKIVVKVGVGRRAGVFVVGADGEEHAVGLIDAPSEKAVNYAKGLRETLGMPVVLKDVLHLN